MSARRLLEADLLTGLVELDRYAREDVPRLLGPSPDPRAERDAVFDAVTPADLSFTAAATYQTLQAAWRNDQPLTDVKLPEWVERYGMRVGYLTRERARQLLTLRAHQTDRWRALQQASECEEQLQTLAGEVR